MILNTSNPTASWAAQAALTEEKPKQSSKEANFCTLQWSLRELKDNSLLQKKCILSTLINRCKKMLHMSPHKLPKNRSSKNILPQERRLEFSTPIRHPQAATYSESNPEFTHNCACNKKSFLFPISSHSNTHSLLTSPHQKPVVTCIQKSSKFNIGPFMWTRLPAGLLSVCFSIINYQRIQKEKTVIPLSSSAKLKRKEEN